MNIIKDINNAISNFRDTNTKEPEFIILSPIAYEELQKSMAEKYEEVAERRNNEQSRYHYTVNPNMSVGIYKGLIVAVKPFGIEYEICIV